jgi:hypothetical protein
MRRNVPNLKAEESHVKYSKRAAAKRGCSMLHGQSIILIALAVIVTSFGWTSASLARLEPARENVSAAENPQNLKTRVKPFQNVTFE